MTNKPLWIDDYRKIVEDVRTKIIFIESVEEISCDYAIKRLFYRTVLTMCEIYTLIDNGYPEGAFALSRQTFESLVLMDYLYINKNDVKLAERFFDDIKVAAIKMTIETKNYIGDISVNEDKLKLEAFANKYKEYCTVEKLFFNDYWWVKKGCKFAELAKCTRFTKNYMYQRTSKVMHISAYNSLVYTGIDESSVLIGSTYDGVELAARFSMLNFMCALQIFQDISKIDMKDIILYIHGFLDRIDKC